MMIDIFYRRPTCTCSGRESFDSSSSLETGNKQSTDGIPERLSFDEVMSGRTSEPCTLKDFGKYLRFSNMDGQADALQFYIWVREYTRRFSNELSKAERSLSPPWRMSTIPTGPSRTLVAKGPSKPGSRSGSSVDLRSVGFGDDVVLKPFTIQPFRSDIDRVISLYLEADSPLALPLTSAERSATLAALHATTHPSAFSVVMSAVERSLRANAHPSFIRHSLSNATTTRLSFISVIGILLIGISICSLVVLTMSKVSRWYRLLTAILLFPGLNMIANARRGLCLLLVVLGMARNLSPWEVYAVDSRESMDGGTEPRKETEDPEKPGAPRVNVRVLDLDNELEGSNKDEETRVRWFIKEYDNRPVLSRVFERRVPIKDAEIRKLQLSMIIQNAAMSIGLTIVVEAIFVALPSGKFF